MSNSSEKLKPIKISYQTKCDLNFCDYITKRALGVKSQIGDNDNINCKLYSNINHNDLINTEQPKDRGGIFNLEFSLDGRLLAAACEKKQVQIYDSLNQKLINSIEYAHSNCVNCIRFLDHQKFATCSDDNSIKLWDMRNLKLPTNTLHGHTNWVKNIEYSERENVMVTSAFDGSIYAWNLKCPTENSMLYDTVFLMNGLMRTKLSPDGSKMVISTTNGYMIIIHDLNLTTLASDLKSFKPYIYRLMQVSEQSFPAGTMFNHLFDPKRRRNRIEFIDDFPNVAQVISSLQLHPHGWCAVSRNLNGEEDEEWTSVHDIQKRSAAEYENAFSVIEEDTTVSETLDTGDRTTDLWMGYISINEHVRLRLLDVWDSYDLPSRGMINSGLIDRNYYRAHFQHNPDQMNKVINNLPRLTHFVKEKNVGKGFIKELCFSSDGRIICSPYDKGIRLLGFNNRFQELSYCVPERPEQLSTLLEMNNYHSDVVVSCKFNPVYLQLVSGCLGSDIKWYQPVY